MQNKFLIFTAFFIIFFANAFGQSGGQFEITQSVVASGGGQNSAGGSFSLDGTIRQNIAGDASIGAPFAVTSGFWNFTPLAPSAATASVSGRILAADGGAIRNVILTLTNAATGEIRSARSSTFGFYRFEEVPVGTSYVLTVSAKKFSFNPNTRVLTILDELTEVNFIALPET